MRLASIARRCALGVLVLFAAASAATPPPGELRVVVGRPQGEVSPDTQIALTFNKPVAPLATVGDQATLPDPATIEPRIAGAWRWLGSSAVEFVPAEPLPPATAFKVTVAPRLMAIDGSKQQSPTTYTFNTLRPGLDMVEPSEGSVWLTPRQQLRLSFNQPVRDLERHAGFEVAGRRIALTVTNRIDVGERERARREEWERFHADTRTAYDVVPVEDLPAGTRVTLVISAALPGELGPLTMTIPRSLAFRTHGAFEMRAAQGCFVSPWSGATCPYGPLILRATNEPDAASLKDRLSIDPPVRVDWDAVQSGVSGTSFGYVAVHGRFKPGTRYTVTVAAGAADVFGQRAPAFRDTFRTDDLDPSLELGDENALIEDSGDGALPIRTVNVRLVEAGTLILTPEEVARYLGDAGRSKTVLAAFGRPPVPWTVSIPSHLNVPRHSPLDVRSRLPLGRSRGIVFVEATYAGRKKEERADRVIAQITDLALHAKLGATGGLAWVTSLSSGRPVEGAAVSLLDRTGRTVWSEGKTGADGLVRLPGMTTLPIGATNGVPFLLAVATKGGDTGITASDWTGGLDPWSFALPTGWDGPVPEALATIFAERGIYRPGDVVHLKGVVRYRRLGVIAAPPADTTAEVEVRSSGGTVLDKRTVTLTRFGTFALDVTLPADVALGFAQASATLAVEGKPVGAYGGFRVEEYRAPQFRVDVSTPAGHLTAGDPLRAGLLARYLFGGAMAGAPVRWTVTRSTTDFVPPGNDGFDFGVNAWWWDDERPQPFSDAFASGEGTTDDKGSVAIEAGRVDTPGGRTVAYTLETEVTDVNRQRIADRALITVHPAALYAGVRLQNTGFAEAGRPATLEAIAVDPQGLRHEGAAIDIVLTRRSWNWIKKKGPAGEWYTDAEAVDEPAGGCRVESAPTTAACVLTPAKPGFHVVAATVTDASGRTQTTRSSFYVIGSGWVSWQRDDTDRIDLVPDKNLYDVGDTARVLVKSPYLEADAIVTVEREGVTSARRVRLKGAASTVDVPLGEDAIPNVFVSVVLVRGRVGGERGVERGDDPGRPATRIGYCELKVERKSKRLAVAVKPDGTEKRPRDKVRVDFAVRDADGRGVPAEITAWAVDEGVLRLTGYEMPDLVEVVHPRRGLSVRNAEPLLKLIERRLYAEKGVSDGGGGGADALGMLRSEFKTTVLFAPEVVTDDQGRAHVELTLPDNLTTYRVMAVAVTAHDRFGAGQAEIAVSKPLLALPALPRLARVGDRFDAGVVLHANGPEASGKVQVTAQAVGVLIDGATVRTVAVAAGKPIEVRFGFRAETPGTATLRFLVRGDSESDSVEQRIPVLLPVGLETVAVYGETTTRVEEALVGPRGVRDDVGGLRITLASTLLGGLAEPMRQLVEYPYGCAEQLSSRLVPFVSLRELQKTYGIVPDPIASYKIQDPDEVVRSTVRALQRLQTPDGAFRYWPESRCADPWVSSYATLALTSARDAGYEVDPDAIERAQRYLAGEVLPGRTIHGCFGPVEVALPERVFALWVLARGGSPRMSYAHELFVSRDKLPLFSRAMLADALAIGGGDRKEAEQLMTELASRAKESAQGVHFEEVESRYGYWPWSSDTRTTAILLMAFTDVAPDHPYVAKIARYLTTTARGRDGRFANTQEAAFTLLAMGRLTKTKERAAPDFAARVALGEHDVASDEFRGRSLGVATRDVPIRSVAGAGTSRLVFEKTGTGILYYTARLQSAPRELPLTPLDRGLAVSRWLTSWGGGNPIREVEAGELVRVQLRVATSQERRYVVLEVPLPAGLEAVDTSLATTARPPGDGAEPEPEYGFWSPFEHVELRDDRALLFADWLPPGVHTLHLVARATTPGRYVLPPARAEELYAPEVFGRSDGGAFEVK